MTARTSRRSPWMTKAEAEAVLRDGLDRLTPDQQMALIGRVELREPPGVDARADLVQALVSNRSASRALLRAPLVGRRSCRHTLMYASILFGSPHLDVDNDDIVRAAFLLFLERVSARQLSQYAEHGMRAVARMFWTVAKAELLSPARELSLIARILAAHLAFDDRVWAWRWAHAHVARWADKYPDRPLPAALTTVFLTSERPDVRAWAYATMLPRVGTGAPLGVCARP